MRVYDGGVRYWRLCLKTAVVFSFRPGFSRVAIVAEFFWKPFKRFPAKVASTNTWLKPGVNETNNS